jgi:hypothetical protein
MSRGPGRYGAANTEKFGFAGMEDLHKVEVSEDGRRVFAGGRGLHRFDSAGGVIRPIEIDTTKGKHPQNFQFLISI